MTDSGFKAAFESPGYLGSMVEPPDTAEESVPDGIYRFNLTLKPDGPTVCAIAFDAGTFTEAQAGGLSGVFVRNIKTYLEGGDEPPKPEPMTRAERRRLERGIEQLEAPTLVLPNGQPIN